MPQPGRRADRGAVSLRGQRRLDAAYERRVVGGVPQTLQQGLQSGLAVPVLQDPAQPAYGGQLGLGQQEFLAAGAGGVDVDGREHAAGGEVAAEPELIVAGALQLLEEVAAGARAGLDQGGGEDGERAALLGLAGGAEEPLGPEQRGG